MTRLISPSGKTIAKRTWSDEPLPLGSVRIHGGKRRIKVNVDGPKSQQWKDYARFWWENFKGPVPEGKRVVCLDGNPLNDAPDNLALMTGGEWILHLRKIRPNVAAKNRLAASAGTARFNREIAAVRRARGEWPAKYFFPVNLETRTIFNAPHRMRWACLAAAGVPIERERWRFARRIERESVVKAVRGSRLRCEPYRSFRVVWNPVFTVPQPQEVF